MLLIIAKTVQLIGVLCPIIWSQVSVGSVSLYSSLVPRPYFLCLGAHAQARYTVVCLCVCVCRPLQLLKDESSASKSFYRLLVMFTWILIRGFAK